MVFNKILPLPKNLIPESSCALLIGKDGTCKTSFLFRYCHTIAQTYTDRTVIYISPVKMLKLPLSVEGMEQLSVSTAQRVTIFYPTTLEDLVEYLAKFFTLNLFPCAFIVDDLDYIIKRKRTTTNQTYNQVLSRVFALLIDNMEHCKSVSGQCCELLVSTGYDLNVTEDLVAIRTIGEHFFDEIYLVDDHQLFASTGKGFEIVPKNRSFKIIVEVYDDSIKLKQVLKKKVKRQVENK